LKQRGIMSVFHYLPLHLSDMGRQRGSRPGDCPIAESISERLLRLPFYNPITQDELARVTEAVAQFHL
jgi:dTDP-4-amino-4,6-dideoxygalactose transaminase